MATDNSKSGKDSKITAVTWRIVHSDPEIVSGTPGFVGTRGPVDALFDQLVAGDSLEVFLDGFPTVEREQALAALEFARDALLREASARSPR